MRALAVAAVLLVACGGGAAPAQSAASAGNAAGTARATTAASSAPATAAAQPAFGEVVKSGKTATYKVSYKITATGPGAPAASSGMAMYFKPPKTRLDITGDDGQGQSGALSIYYLENGSFTCTVSGSDKFCFQVSADAAAAQAAGFELQQDLAAEAGSLNAAFKENRSIAGQSALCYVVKGTASLGFTEGTFCYTSSGVPLLSTWSAAGATWTMEATSFSASVPDSDFVLPAPPGKMPGAP
jgi:hypothetical protein